MREIDTYMRSQHCLVPIVTREQKDGTQNAVLKPAGGIAEVLEVYCSGAFVSKAEELDEHTLRVAPPCGDLYFVSTAPHNAHRFPVYESSKEGAR